MSARNPGGFVIRRRRGPCCLNGGLLARNRAADSAPRDRLADQGRQISAGDRTTTGIAQEAGGQR